MRTILALAAMSVVGCAGDTATEVPDDTNDTPPIIIEVPEPPDEAPGDDITDFFEEEAFVYEIHEGTLDPAGDRDFFAFDATAGEIYGFYTMAYAFNQMTEPDTVIRVWDPSGNLVTENDDMLYRYQQTDSALYFQAETDGTYNVEVLEWADWAGEATVGGPSFEYVLAGWIVPITEHEGANDTIEEVTADVSEEFLFYGSQYSDYDSEYYGIIDTVGDVDLIEFDWRVTEDTPIEDRPLDEERTHYFAASVWPDSTNAALEVSLLNKNGEVVATTTDINPTPDYRAWWDTTLLAKVDPDQPYYLRIQDTEDNSGVGTFHPIVVTNFLATFSTREEEPNDDAGNAIVMEESQTTAGVFFGDMAGDMPDGDLMDVFTIDPSTIEGLDDLNGKYLSIDVASLSVGSQLDVKMTIRSGDTVLAESLIDSERDDHADPSVRDLLLTGPVTVTIEAESRGAEALANQWFLLAILGDEPDEDAE